MKGFLRNLEDEELNNKCKIKSLDNFELVYIRHKYFRKSSNPSEERLNQFEEMICNISDKIYYKKIKIFKTTGLEIEDLRSVGRINTVSFISMSGLKENPSLMKRFIKDHKNKFGKDSMPTDRDIFLRECYNLSRYLNQRLYEVVRFCEIKNKNIIGTRAKTHYFVGPSTVSVKDDLLLRDHKSYGFKKITKKTFNELAEKTNSLKKEAFFISPDQIARSVTAKIDLNSLDNFYSENCYNELSLSPEDILLAREHEQLCIEKFNKNKKKYNRNKLKKILNLL